MKPTRVTFRKVPSTAVTLYVSQGSNTEFTATQHAVRGPGPRWTLSYLAGVFGTPTTVKLTSLNECRRHAERLVGGGV